MICTINILTRINMPAKSKKQQKFFGIVRALQKGKKVKGATKKAKDTAKTISKKAAKDYASTSHDNLPIKKESFKDFFFNKYL